MAVTFAKQGIENPTPEQINDCFVKTAKRNVELCQMVIYGHNVETGPELPRRTTGRRQCLVRSGLHQVQKGSAMNSQSLYTVELPKCQNQGCNRTFNPMCDSPDENGLYHGEYHENREAAHKAGKLYPWEKEPAAHPYTFCSQDCEWEVLGEYGQSMAEQWADFQHDLETGVIEDALDTAVYFDRGYLS